MLKNNFYYFSGKDEENRSIHGVINAHNKSIAHYLLLKLGLTKINYLIIKFSSLKKTFYLTIKEKHRFFLHLSMLIDSGHSIIESIKIIKLDATSFKLKYILYLILINLQEGYQLSVAFDKLPFNSFTKTETKLIRVAETSGTLDKTLQFIHKKLENNLNIQQKIIAASIYPSITIGISCIVVFIIFNYIMPQFETLFVKNNHTLPWITEFVFSVSRNLKYYFLFLIGLLTIVFCIIKFSLRWNLISAKFKENCVLKIPIVGKIILTTNRINFGYTLSILLRAGIPIDEALTETIENLTLPYSKYRLKQAMLELISGRNLSSALKKTQFFSRSAISTIVTAENTGRLDDAFNFISQQQTNELSAFSDHVEKFIEPFIIILLGGIIGIVVIAIYLPIFQLGSLY